MCFHTGLPYITMCHASFAYGASKHTSCDSKAAGPRSLCSVIHIPTPEDKEYLQKYLSLTINFVLLIFLDKSTAKPFPPPEGINKSDYKHINA